MRTRDRVPVLAPETVRGRGMTPGNHLQTKMHVLRGEWDCGKMAGRVTGRERVHRWTETQTQRTDR